MDDVHALVSNAVAILAVLVIGAGYIASIRQKKDHSNTDNARESTNQAEFRARAELLKDARADALAARADAESARLDAVEARRQARIDVEGVEQRCKVLDGLFATARIGWEKKEHGLLSQIGDKNEEIAHWKQLAEAKDGELVYLRAGINQGKFDINEANRAMTAHYELELHKLRIENASLEDRLRFYINLHHGDGTATGILGPHE